MMAVSAALVPSGPQWTYEVKWDGYRAQIIKSGAPVSLASRNLKNITAHFPAVVQAASRLGAKSAVVDGEIVALDASGRPSFQALHHSATSGYSLVYYAFDLLHLDGRDLIDVPLEDRRAALGRVIGQSGLLLSEPLPGSPGEIEAAVRRLQLEGIVAKLRHSRYEPGRRSDAWVKVRFARHQEFVIGGYKPAAGTFDSVVVGYWAADAPHPAAARQKLRSARRLLCAGKVRGGFTPHLRAALYERLKPIGVTRCPFANLPTTKSGHWGEGIDAEEMRALRWVRPLVVVEIAFVEWTRDRNLRHASFLGLREDKDARDVYRDVDSV
jgi:bifunctional non-homologous end joining protein LigD